MIHSSLLKTIGKKEWIVCLNWIEPNQWRYIIYLDRVYSSCRSIYPRVYWLLRCSRASFLGHQATAQLSLVLLSTFNPPVLLQCILHEYCTVTVLHACAVVILSVIIDSQSRFRDTILSILHSVVMMYKYGTFTHSLIILKYELRR